MSNTKKNTIRVTKAYSTVSHEACHVLAGVLPIHLEMNKRIALYYLRKKRTVELNGIRIEGNDLVEGKVKMPEAKKRIEETLLDE